MTDFTFKCNRFFVKQFKICCECAGCYCKCKVRRLYVSYLGAYNRED